MTITTIPLTGELLDELTERIRLTREHVHPSGERVPVSIQPCEAEALVAAARRVEALERLVVKLATHVPPATALLLLPAEAAEYDELLTRSAAQVAEANAAWVVTP